MWARADDFQVLDTRFRIQAEDARAAKEMTGLLAEFHLDRRVGVRGRNTFGFVTANTLELENPRLYRDCARLGTADYDILYVRLLTALNRIAVGEYDGFAVHAGVVARGDRAIALPADTGGGKSTLTAACIQVGFDYISDESLCIDLETGMVEPYPKPVMLSPESHELLGITNGHVGEVPFTAGDLGGTVARGNLQLTDVVFPEYGHDGAALTRLPSSQIVAGLLDLSFNHYKHPAEAFRLVTSLARSARAWRLTYNDPLEAAALLDRELADH